MILRAIFFTALKVFYCGLPDTEAEEMLLLM